MTIEQTITIPDDRRVSFEFLASREIPTGPARIKLNITPVHGRQNNSVPENNNKRTSPRADRLLGIAAHLGDIGLEEIRAERLAKYLI